MRPVHTRPRRATLEEQGHQGTRERLEHQVLTRRAGDTGLSSPLLYNPLPSPILAPHPEPTPTPSLPLSLPLPLSLSLSLPLSYGAESAMCCNVAPPAFMPMSVTRAEQPNAAALASTAIALEVRSTVDQSTIARRDLDIIRREGRERELGGQGERQWEARSDGATAHTSGHRDEERARKTTGARRAAESSCREHEAGLLPARSKTTAGEPAERQFEEPQRLEYRLGNA